MLADVFRIHRDGVLSVLCGRTIGVWEGGGLGVCGWGLMVGVGLVGWVGEAKKKRRLCRREGGILTPVIVSISVHLHQSIR